MPYAPKNTDDDFELDAGLISIIESNNNNWDNMVEINDPCDKGTVNHSSSNSK